ncbi:NlpC/P60 family protein [Thermomonospora echinospora]|uniref:NlpC/P60 family protein n=1 Tax=Thermomonospora echinospora TaxID=1992 RepID=A0A1H6A9F2_9ACTN|nr:NlpC/P60 family protein [Thermomonospora echinospora]SEG44992.1 NlpC/P60 family protein [Thermomonospora echinospora]
MADERRRVQFDFIGRDQLSQVMRRMGEDAEKLDGQMAAMGAAAGALAGPIAAAGASFLGFAAVARPAIMGVVEAQEDLVGSWEDLSSTQRVSAAGLRDLRGEFQELAASYEPQALAIFNQVMDDATDLLPEFTKLADAGAIGVDSLVDRLGAFATGPEVASFVQFAAETGPEAMDQLGQAATTTGEIALQTVQDMAPLGLSMLQLANGTLSAVNAAASWNPALAQMAVTTLLLRGPLTAMVGGVGGMATRMREAAAPTQNLSRGQKALNLAAAAGPGLYIAAGAALGFLAVKTLTAKSETEKMADSLRSTYRAFGNNVEGFQTWAGVLRTQFTQAVGGADVALRKVNIGGREMEAWVDTSTGKVRILSSGQQDLADKIAFADGHVRKLNGAIAQVASTFGISQDAAKRLADAAGVDLAASLDKSGNLTQEAVLKLGAYRSAAQQANDPSWRLSQTMKILADNTSTAEQRTQALTSAYNAELGPAIAAINANLQLKDGYAQLSEQLSKAKARMNGSGEASRQLQQNLVQQIDTVWRLYQANVEQNGTTEQGTAAVRRQLPVLYALAGRNTELRKLVDALARSTGNVTGVTDISRRSFLRMAESMRIGRAAAERLWDELKQMKDRKVDILVHGKGNWSVGGAHPGAKFPGMAAGGAVPLVSGAEPGKDSVPALLMPDEHVWTTREVAAAGGHEAMFRLRKAALAGHLKGYAKGGPVNMTSARVSPQRAADIITEPIWEGMTGLVASIGREMGRQWKKYMMSGGGVVAAARSMIGYPYSWGGGGKGGPSYGIGRGARTFGFDCSGLTEYAWWKGRGISIGGTTYSQHPNSVAIGTPKPGALGFPHMGHVVIASNRPGYIIEAPYTGAHVRERAASSGYDWRWPKAAFYAGGPVKRLGELATTPMALRAEREMARLAQVIGNPSRRRAHGGPISAGLPYLVGEMGPEVVVPRVGGTVHPAASAAGGTTITIERLELRFADDRNLVEKGRQFAEALRAYKSKGGQLP